MAFPNTKKWYQQLVSDPIWGLTLIPTTGVDDDGDNHPGYPNPSIPSHKTCCEAQDLHLDMRTPTSWKAARP